MKLRRLFYRLAPRLTAIALISTHVAAQTDLDDEEVYNLSPFVIDSSDEEGYLAKSSLQGSRMKMSLDDISVPMDIITPELMEDFGITQQEDLFDVVSNMDDRNNEFLSGVYESGASYSIRGFVGVRSLRNFAVSPMPFDRYSSGSLTASKGPNAILYGSGPGGGSISFFTKRHTLGGNNRRKVSFTLDHIGSVRGEFSIDQVIVEDKLGINFSTFSDKKEFFIEPSYEDRQGYYLNIAYRPFEGTDINVSYERRNDDVFRPASSYTTLTDYNTTWTAFGEPAVVDTNVSANVSTLLIDGVETDVDIRQYGLSRISSTRLAVFDGQVTDYRNAAATDRPLIGNAIQRNRSWLQYIVSDWPEDINPTGLNGGAEFDAETFDIVLEQKVTDDLYATATYSNSESTRLQYQHNMRQIYRDPNYYTPGSDGTEVNPHYGEYYLEQTNYNFFDRTYNTEVFSAMATYQLDLEKHNKYFGVHSMAGMYQFLTEEVQNIRQSFRLTDRADDPTYTLGAVSSAPTLVIREYIGFDASKGGYLQDYRYLHDQGYYENDGYRWELFDGVGGSGWRKTTTESKMLMLQSSWLGKRIITSFGYRPEKVKQYVVNFANNPNMNYQQTAYEHFTKEQSEDPNYTRVLTDEIRPSSYPDIPWQTVKGNSKNAGLIVKVTPNIALIANKASNISGNAGRIGIFGVSLPNQDAQSTDLGLRVNLFDQKLRFEYTNYETDVTNAARQSNAGNMRIPNAQVQDIWETMFSQGVVSQNVFLNGENWDTRDFVATGHEFTVTANPIRGLTLRLAASKNTKVANNQGGTFMPWWNDNKDAIEAFVNSNPDAINPLDTATTPLTALQSWESAVDRLRLREDIVGTEETNIPIWTAKLVGKYAFQDGFLKGHQTGVNVAWRGKMKSNYFRLADDSSDLDDPFYTDSTIHVNWFWSHRRKIMNDRIDWKVQLNISNIFNMDTTLPRYFYNTVDGDYSSDVVYSGVRRYDPRRISITNTFSF